MSLPIITAGPRLAERRGVKGVLVGKSGIGKTSQLWALKPTATLFFDLEAGDLAVEGWAEASELGIIELAKRFEGAGVAAIIYTDIDRDGVLAGINWDATIALADAVSIPVIASGGLASLADIRRMTMPDAARLEGAISGRALYDGRIDPAEALAILRAA